MPVDITTLADVIIPEVFDRYSQERTAAKWDLLKAGVVQRDAEWDAKANEGGLTVQMPFFKDLSGNSEITPGDGIRELNVAKIGSGKDIAAQQVRSKMWGTNDLAGVFSNSDPMGAIGLLAGDYWQRELQRILILTTLGVFAAPSMADKVITSYFNTDVTANGAKLFDRDLFIDCCATMGDASGRVTSVGIHSTVYHRLWKAEKIIVEKDSTGSEFQSYEGRRIVVDDSMPKIAVTGGFKYLSVLYGAGAFAYGEGTPKKSVEVAREARKLNDLLANHKKFLLHPRGVKFKGSVADESASDTELQDANSWELVFEPKNVRLAGVWTNG